MTDQYCHKHEKPVKLRVFVYCPVCRSSKGGTKAANAMSAKAKSERAKKAARARWKKARKNR